MIDLLGGDTKFQDEVIRLRGNDIPVKRGFVDQMDLQFYPENPRVYSIVMREGDDPSQQEILNQLGKMDHVQQLVKSIKLNKGLIEPIIVRNGDGVVLEGNSRLAAYRILASDEPLDWARIDCKVLEVDVSESVIFSLLGEFHIVGKKDWAPFEQAGYLFRRKNKHGVSLPDLEKEVGGLSRREIGHLIRVYEYMIDSHESDISKWSYYDAFLRSRKLKIATVKYEGLEAKIVRMIRNDEFKRAADLRDKMPVVIELGNKIVRKLISNEVSFDYALERAESRADSSGTVKTARKFREWICDVEIGDDIAGLSSEAKSECKYELKRVKRRITALMDSALR